MGLPPAGCDDCPVRDHAVCAALSSGERDELARIGHHRDFKRGETIFAAGDDSIACATLVSGAIKLSQYDSEGTERIQALVHPAGFLGQLFAAEVEQHATALCDSRLCLFPRADFERLMARHPALTRAILDRTLSELRETRSLVDLIGRRDARARVVGLLLSFARTAGTSPCTLADAFDMPLTRGEAAGLLGITIETVSRQLGRLEEEGLISREGSRGIVLRDVGALQAEFA
jgi:CRP/FNR family transcriptional regulator